MHESRTTTAADSLLISNANAQKNSLNNNNNKMALTSPSPTSNAKTLLNKSNSNSIMQCRLCQHVFLNSQFMVNPIYKKKTICCHVIDQQQICNLKFAIN
jgi:hypothetical protein